MLPFLFYLPKSSVNGFRYLGLRNDNDKDIWVVKIAKYDYSLYNSEWMCDPILGNACLIPSVDLTEDQHVFYSEAEALEFIKNWWKNQ